MGVGVVLSAVPFGEGVELVEGEGEAVGRAGESVGVGLVLLDAPARVGEVEGQGVREEVVEGVAVGLGEADSVAVREGEALLLPHPDPLRVAFPVEVTLGDRDWVGDWEGLTVVVREKRVLGVGEEDKLVLAQDLQKWVRACVLCVASEINTMPSTKRVA